MQAANGGIGEVAVGQRTSLTDDVYLRLRRDIVSGALRPNEALVEADLAEKLGVSRTPVRESMQRLASDGLIVSHRRRWVVYEHKPREIVELYEIRAALEGQAARLAAQRITPERDTELEAMRADATRPDLEGQPRVQVNEAFHSLVCRISANARLVNLIAKSQLYHFNTRIAALYSTADLAVSAAQHGEIIDALIARDADAAGQLARGHVESALELILKKLG